MGFVRGGVVALGGALVAAALGAPPANAQPPAEDVVGLVIERQSGTSAAQVQQQVEALVDTETTRTAIAPGVTAVTVPDLDPQQARRAAEQLRAQDGIASVGIDTRVHPAAVPNDPRFSEQWALTDPVSGMGAPSAWELGQGQGAVIAVIDSGITAHEDLADKVLPGYDMIADPVVANDGDARDPDPSDPGDWVDGNDLNAHPDEFDSSCLADSSWHGGHVAGLAAAATNNGKGIAGMAPLASILPVRALGKCGGRMSDIAAAITWASGGSVPGAPANPHPADVINLSVSSDATCQPFVQSAIDAAIGRGTTVVVSAGNSAAPISKFSPAGCYDVIAVGALARDGKRAPYSNYGVAGRTLPLFAPGGTEGSAATALLSAVNAGTKAPTPAKDTYDAYAGTSMAAPMVAGAAAILHKATGMGPLAIGEHLRDTARPFPASSNCTGSCGAGIVDIHAALTTSPRLPAAPTDIAVLAADGAVSAQWNPPEDTGTAPITGYVVQYRPHDGQWSTAESPWTSTLPRRVVAGLTNGVSYRLRIAARTVFGQGDWAESTAVTPMALPGNVQIARVNYPTTRSARIRLELPADSFDAMQYRLVREGWEPGPWKDSPPISSLRFRVPKGIRHTVEVRVVNDLGAGGTASRTIATPVKPGAPLNLTVKRNGSSAKVRWTAPVRTGLKLRYQVRVGESRWRKTKGTEITLRGIKPGPAMFQVRGINEAGKGATSSSMKRK